MAPEAPKSLAQLQANLSASHRDLLDHIWNHFKAKGEWISTKAVHQRFGKPGVLEARKGLGGSIVFEMSEQPGKERYHLTLLGVLLTSDGSRAEGLLVQYVGHLRGLFDADPDVGSVSGKDVQTALNLTTEDSKVLGCLIDLGRLWSGTSGGLGRDENWSAGVPREIDDLPAVSDPAAYVRARALERFDPNLPVGESERMRYTVMREHENLAEETEDLASEHVDRTLQREPASARSDQWDAFICHASEDKVSVVEPLVHAIRALGLTVWYDKSQLVIGDSLRRKIDEGLARSRFGIVILSPDFFKKEWPQKELDGLVQKEIAGHKVILPVWHNVSRDDVAAHSVALVDKSAGHTRAGIPSLAKDLSIAMGRAESQPMRGVEPGVSSLPVDNLMTGDDGPLSRSGSVVDAIRAVKLGRRDAAAGVRQYMELLTKDLDSLRPHLIKGDEDDLLVEALSKGAHLVSEYGRLAAVVAEGANGEAATAMFQGFSGILNGYELPRGFSGQFLRTQFDYNKFLGHELCTMLFQRLLLDRRWDIISSLLEEGVYVENTGSGRSDVVGLEYFSQHTELLDLRGQRTRLRPGWGRAHLLAERHSSGKLGLTSPTEAFVDVDFLLLLASHGRPGAFGDRLLWRPWSIFIAKGIPRFLLEAYRVRQAETLRQLVRASDLDTLRARIKERLVDVGRFVGGFGFHSFEGLDLARIGTE